MNCSNKFKLTVVAMMVGTSMNANAALYRVIEVDPGVNGDNIDYSTAFGVAIQQGDVAADPSTGVPFALGCFDSAAGCIPEQFKLAIETRTTNLSEGAAVDGVSYREEVPFASDSIFDYIDDYDDFERYCDYERRYSTCESWAAIQWQPYGKELAKDFTTNAFALVEKSPTAYANQYNNIINSLTEAGEAIGNQSVVSASNSSVLKTRNEIVAPVIPNTDTGVKESRAWNTDGTFTVGSISRAANNKNGARHSSKAAIWDSNKDIVEVPWTSGVQFVESEHIAQGSMRDLVVDTSKNIIYGVGYNTWRDNNYMNATVFVGSLNASAKDEKSINNYSWNSVLVDDAQQRISDETVHSNSRLTDVNSNFVAIGEAKRSGQYPMPTGSFPNRLFIVKDVRESSPKAIFPTDGIFFDGAGGTMGGINASNEIVGQLDAETSREDEGKPRRKRGFIYPYSPDGTESARSKALFDNKAWFLDNLTNGGDYSAANNAFRIISATDINDAGVISATAMKCEGGYKTTQHNSSCAETEKIVAVKLMPIAGATSANIQKRSIEEEAVERQGAGLGWLALTMLSLFGFRRK
ncbi:DUF3466 family protein [Vibrio sp. AND4]|uniref:DUF3466 family protein n=1 Tax=Vibrio sp. AND4 TaxID=314289 RepID=UPI00015EFB92|nr:DUF3466 family protein [Vibrio sp. AND4]EDP60002.1 hypothetical protein AND4_01298 [Vibrio sp. AND4]